MKNFKIIILLFIASVFAFAGNLNFDLFTAKSTGSAINIEWKFAGDAAVNYYEIERSNDNYILSEKFQHINQRMTDLFISMPIKMLFYKQTMAVLL